MANALTPRQNQALRLGLAMPIRQALFHELTEDDYLPMLARARGPISTKTLRALTPAKFALAQATTALAQATPPAPPLTPEQKAKRRPPAPEYLGRLRSIPLVAETVAGIGNAAADFSELYETPMIVRRMQFSTTATLIDTMEVLLVVGTNITAIEVDVKRMVPVWPDGLEFQDLGRVIINAAGAPVSIPLAVPITIIPFRIGLWIQNITAGPFRMQAIVTLQEGEAEFVNITRIVVPQFVRAPAIPARPAAPRVAGPPSSPIPRGVTIKVLERGQPILSRDIAWPSLDVNLKREFLNAQLSGNYPPTMQPIW